LRNSGIEGLGDSGIGRLRDWKFGIQSAIPEFAIPEFHGPKGFDSL
jgi:hypothetical protein